MQTQRHESDKQAEANLDSMRLDHDNIDDLENIYANTQIYANTNMLAMNDYANANCTTPMGRKPALPPKPSSQANTMKRNRSTTVATVPTVPVPPPPPATHPNGECSARKDPAEMSLKERLALFEQSTQTIKLIATAPKIQASSAPMSLPKKPTPNTVKTTESAAIIHASTVSNEISKSKCRIPIP